MTALPGFTVTIDPGPRFVPGPRPGRSFAWETWNDGAAPPAAALSKGGIDGTLAYFDRLSDALGRVARRLPGRPERGPFLVYDFVSGRVITLTYTPPAPDSGGPATVYFVTDGEAMKVGYTETTVAQRIAGLQTGNPRTIRPVITIHGVGVDVEAALHSAFGEHHRTGEWFDLTAVERLADDAGGWPDLIARTLAAGPWHVQIHSPATSN